MSIYGRFVKILEVVGYLCRDCRELETALDRIQQKTEKVNMGLKTAKELLVEVDQATTDVATRIQALLDQIGDDTAGAELEELKTGIVAQIERLRTMGTGGTVDPVENP